jgi:photosystem II stability/assembly factor-like uncharacterized protein
MSHREDRTRLIVGTATGVCQVVSSADGAAEIIGPMTPLPHAVARLAVCRERPQVAYLAAYEGGMWRSDDGGETWRQLRSYPVEHAHSVVVDPHDPAIVYVGSEPAAIFHSHDGGATWQECESFRAVPESKHWHFFAPRHAHVRDLAMAADDAQRLYAGLEVGGVVRSTDGGATWQQLHGPYEDVHSLSVTPARAQTLYAATARQPWRSDDGGETWTAIGHGLPHRYIVPIAAAPDDPDVVLVSCSTSFQRQTGVLGRSADGGRSWQKTSWPGPHDDMVIAIAWDTMEPQVVFAGTDGGKLYRSTDRGASWQALPVTLDRVAVGGLIVVPR